MGRQLRIIFPGAVYHVVARGNERKNIFRDAMDRRVLLKLTGEAKQKFGFKLFAYTLMSNHYHFLFKCENSNLPLLMHHINSNYAIYFNRKYKRLGHFFQSRYGTTLVEHGPALMEEVRYIHLNPIRAGMVDKLTEYEWTSHKQYNGATDKGIAEPEHILKYFSETRKDAVDKYEAYMADGSRKDRDGDRIGPYGKRILGSDDFIKRIKLILKDKKLSVEIANRTELKKVYPADDIIKAAATYFKTTENELITKKGRWNPGKRILIYLLSRDGGLNNAGISSLLKLHHSGIGPLITKVDIEIKEGKKSKKDVKLISREYAII